MGGTTGSIPPLFDANPRPDDSVRSGFGLDIANRACLNIHQRVSWNFRTSWVGDGRLEEDHGSQELPASLIQRQVGVADAEGILTIVFEADPADAADLTRPSAADLANDIRALQDYFTEIKLLNSFEKWKDYARLYKSVRDKADQLTKALQRLNESWSAVYFHLSCQSFEPSQEDAEITHPPEDLASELTFRLVKDFDVTLKHLEATHATSKGDKWYEHIEPSAMEWLYGVGLPELFTRSFKTSYQLPSDGSTTPAYRFNNAVVEVAGLRASTGLSNMRRLEAKHRGRRTLWGLEGLR